MPDVWRDAVEGINTDLPDHLKITSADALYAVIDQQNTGTLSLSDLETAIKYTMRTRTDTQARIAAELAEVQKQQQQPPGRPSERKLQS